MASTNMASVLDVKNLSVTLRSGGQERLLLKSISFSVPRRSVLGIMGESGSGKTVLSRAIVNWVRPPLYISGGEVIYNGQNVLAMSDSETANLRGREIAYIGADPGSALDPTLPVGRQILSKLLAVEPGIGRATARRRVIDLLDAVRIPQAGKRFDEYPFQFSGGMMQRALIVDALVSNPRLLVADNITQPLDVTVAAQILRLLRELQNDFDTAVVFISSSLGTVSEIADDVLVLDAGQVVEQASVHDIIHQPQYDYTHRLLERAPRIWTDDAQVAPSTRNDDIVLDVVDVAKTYEIRDRNAVFTKRRVQAVRGVSFNVRRGESFGLIGESGCGKSTLSRLLSYLEPTDGGRIMFDGVDVTGLKGRELLRLRRRFQLLLQDPYNAIPAQKSIGSTIGEPMRIHGLCRGAELRQRVLATMQEVGLPAELYDQLPIGLSAGQRQRVNIARALVLEPELLILDETLSSLDQVEQARFIDLFESLQAQRGITYIYISHDLALVRRVCQRIAVMYLGRIVELADNASIFELPAHPYTRALLSAAPTIENRPFAVETYLLDGEPPDPVDIAPGCSFRSRCPFAFDRCAVEDPMPRNIQGSGVAACFLDADGMPDPQWHTDNTEAAPA